MDFIGFLYLQNTKVSLSTINIFKTKQELLFAMASYFIEIARKAIEEHDEFNVALSGGKSPIKLYELLSSTEYRSRIDWGKVSFFFGDERYLPDDDPQNNSFMIQKYLFNPLKIAESKIFRIDTTLTPDEAAKEYHNTIVAHFKENLVRFDLILLGLGQNAHTASLFPFTPVLYESTPTVRAVFLTEQMSYRITMTAPMINRSKHIAFLVYGREKAEAVRHVMKDVRDVQKYPAQLIHPEKGELQWFLDEAAAMLLEIR